MIELVGKCKIDFEKWYEGYIMSQREDYKMRFHISQVLRKFYRMIPSMQYGVYVDFFRQAINKKGVECIVHDFCENCIIGLTTEEAIKHAVKNANKAYNDAKELWHVI